ncbi:MAG: 30S ribosomal protein S20 [Patescibacteria group bacterium]
MPVKKAAIKDLKQSKKKAVINSNKRLNVKYLVKKTTLAIKGSDKTKALELFQKTQKALDKAAKTNVINKNTAARKKSRLVKKINALTK